MSLYWVNQEKKWNTIKKKTIKFNLQLQTSVDMVPQENMFLNIT